MTGRKFPTISREGCTIRFNVVEENQIMLPPGGRFDSGEAAATNQTELYFCGDNMVYLINADLADESGYRNAILWNYDAKTVANTIGKEGKDCIRLDDCKPVDNGKKVYKLKNWDTTSPELVTTSGTRHVIRT